MRGTFRVPMSRATRRNVSHALHTIDVQLQRRKIPHQAPQTDAYLGTLAVGWGISVFTDDPTIVGIGNWKGEYIYLAPTHVPARVEKLVQQVPERIKFLHHLVSELSPAACERVLKFLRAHHGERLWMQAPLGKGKARLFVHPRGVPPWTIRELIENRGTGTLDLDVQLPR